MTIDHLLYVGPDLGELVRDIEDRAGVEAAAGGTHPGQGTHNALLDLGDERYLELMAPDPQQTMTSPTATPFMFHRSIAYASTPQLFTWCAKTSDAAAFAAAARSLGLSVATFPGSRLTPAGTELRWELVTVAGHGLGGVVPFFIDWHDSPHPARSARAARTGPGLRLTELELRHPDSRALANLLAALADAASGGVATADTDSPRLSIVAGAAASLVARFEGTKGAFELTGRGGQLLS